MMAFVQNTEGNEACADPADNSGTLEPLVDGTPETHLSLLSGSLLHGYIKIILF